METTQKKLVPAWWEQNKCLITGGTISGTLPPKRDQKKQFKKETN
ncbi:hypothetical protein Phi13:2_gp044 [Cellulophaga phage phi13:2]|uniref:Uncharacterized protein n=1 Tax=Cellulophaga phage phi13:2 TaxID=1328030 RepID=S0A250_9CAUD|nr:hypothetical protein Phi13:2_gp044 [Cellulophaga phage phi13:2]AGO49654.1 hypothetical protein Phi13:2_gp044 [Cellulophaga phage phi13:2]